MAKTRTAGTSTQPRTPTFEMVSKERVDGDRYRVAYRRGEKEFACNVRLGSLKSEIAGLKKSAERLSGEDKTRTEAVLASKVWLAAQLETEGDGDNAGKTE